MADELDRLLIGAGEAPPDRRIEFRDAIAQHGGRAVERLEGWLADPKYAGFAIRTIARAAQYGAEAEAIAALERFRNAASSLARADIDTELARLVPKRLRGSRTKSLASRSITVSTTLIVGQAYRRKDLHDAGWGGNRQRGISYPAGGDHVLLFSDPAKRHEYGYKDSWDGTTRYRYFGEWNGPGDMDMTAGNAVVRDRSPHLHLFAMSSRGYRYQGRFRYIEHYIERTERDGRSLNAIVFLIERVAAD
jgi:hypothetical protein